MSMKKKIENSAEKWNRLDLFENSLSPMMLNALDKFLLI